MGFLPSGPELVVALVLGIPIAMLVGVYFLPTYVALHRRRDQAMAIYAVNLCLGWTILGWILAILWAGMGKTTR